MYSVQRNNFYENEKKTTVYTPKLLSDFLYKILSDIFDKEKIILDPCVGEGSLLKKWKENGYKTIGIDIKNQGWDGTIVKNFLTIDNDFLKNKKIKPDLIIINPPFNIENITRLGLAEAKINNGRPFIPEIFLEKIIELFGISIPIVMFTPYGLRLNVVSKSKRLQKFNEGKLPEIKSIISLPKNIYKNVQFHSEILIFNINNDKLKPHYFTNFKESDNEFIK